MADCDFPVRRTGTIARIDLGRPDEGNALTRAMMTRLAATIRSAATDDVALVVIEARGSQFCRGIEWVAGAHRDDGPGARRL